MVAFFISIALQSGNSSCRSLGAISFGRRLAALSGRFGPRFGRAGAGRGFTFVGGFAGRFALTSTLACALTCTLRTGFAVTSPFLELRTHRFAIACLAAISAGCRSINCTGLAAGGLVAGTIAALMSDGTVAGQGRFQALAAAALDFVGSCTGAYTCRGGVTQIRDDTGRARHLVADLFELVEN